MKRRLIAGLAIALVAVVVWQASVRVVSADDRTYQFVEVTRGDVIDSIAATGTIEAVGTVEVGTQVSGTIAEILVDYNDHVRKGQVMAVLDTVLLSTSVTDAEANLLKAQAQQLDAERDYARVSELHEKQLVSDADREDSETALMAADASVLSAEAALTRAEANLDYAVITSPISGTVIQRNIEEGQTVAASLSAPVLFMVAEDLAEMEIHALVDESDIGQVEVGQPVTFTVSAHTGEEFEGIVRQVWLQPETVSNVVNYTVVVDAHNPDQMLLPGMTATVDFVVEESVDVLKVPNAALRFEPTAGMIEEMAEARAASGDRPARPMVPDTGTDGEALDSGGYGEQRERTPFELPEDVAMLWYLDEDGALAVARVEKGVSDGKYTEIAGEEIAEGSRIISAATGTSLADAGTGGPPRMGMGMGMGRPPR
jgi:HlyD family secretion protein